MSPLLATLTVCISAAALEGICAGSNVKPFFSSLRFPRYSAPLWVWSIIGVAYYLIFGFTLYRVLRLDQASNLRLVSIVLIISMMTVNALTNYVIFRAKNLRLAFFIGALFPVLDLTLFVLMLQLDATVAMFLVPYLVYRIYAVYWGFALWKANPDLGGHP